MSEPDSRLRGLTEAEAASLRAAGKANAAPPPTGRTYWHIVKDNLFTFVNLAIFLLGVALAIVGRPVDALLSVGIISINILVSLVQEIRAKRILDRIALLTRPQARVVRDGQEKTLPPDAIVLGDLLRLEPGDQVLVDGTVAAGQMAVDESQLTGESDLIRKQPGDMVYSGSFCVTGAAYYQADKVGSESFANRLTAEARAFRRVFTPLQRQINLMVRLILFIVLYLQILLLANNLLRAVPLPDGVEQATVIVSLVPNGLFLSIAVAYALAAVRIVRFGALIQQSNAVESLSNVDVLCLDKTGTLTTNRLQFERVLPLMGREEDEVRALLGRMMASSRSRNKTAEAIAARVPGQAGTPVAEVPFSSARKWSALAFADEPHGIYAIGAPEMLRPYVATDDPAMANCWQEIMIQVHALANTGLRVLLFAHHPDPNLLHDDEDASRLPDGLAPLALVCLSDELRPEAREVLAAFISYGVNPKIISGDSAETVAALARQAGLGAEAVLVSGPELERMDPAEIEHAAVNGTIFGRISPHQKEQLVDALRRRGHYVAMIGDGVNDVLSLKRADLGIAMQSGSQAARGVADIVLINDSFASLSPAVEEGQRIVNGMQDILKIFLTRILTMMLVILSAWTIGIFPVNVRHGTLVTLFSVGIPTVLLAVWARAGFRYYHTLVRRLVHFVVPASLLASLLAVVIFYVTLAWSLSAEARALPAEVFFDQYATVIRHSQTALAVFLTLVGLGALPFVEPPTEWFVGGDVYSGDWRPTILALVLGAALAVILSVDRFRAFFNMTALTGRDLFIVIGCFVLWFLLVRAAWRHQWLERFLGLQDEEPILTRSR